MWHQILKKEETCKECGWKWEKNKHNPKCPLCDEYPYRYGRDIKRNGD